MSIVFGSCCILDRLAQLERKIDTLRDKSTYVDRYDVPMRQETLRLCHKRPGWVVLLLLWSQRGCHRTLR